VVAGLCGLVVVDRRVIADLVFKPEWYVPVTALPLHLSLPLASGLASVLYAAMTVAGRSLGELKHVFWFLEDEDGEVHK
jgi:hypothetical protein